MASSQHIDRICLAAALLSLLAALVFVNGAAFGIQPASQAMGYEDRLFDTSRVHTVDIVMDGWESFLETCENEEYAACSVVIDGESYKNVGLRAKGNTSLSMVSSMDSSRYSFKLEFDHYDSGRTYYGLDKLCLNNLIQDNTMMKDYLAYRLMADFGADAPLCSYVFITVNGQDWGLYLAVEGIEDAFLQRAYGKDHGSLYKPDSLSLGGGRGNGRDFNLEDLPQTDRDLPQPPSDGEGAPGPDAAPDRQGGGFGGMGASDVKLQYMDDDPASYENIFSNAKTEVTEADQARLIASLKALGEGDASVLDTDAVLRYFVVHNYVCNGDSYTGSMVHNYYLYEDGGVLSMLPWDYNLAFGSFQNQDASSAVNDPIDSPLSVTGDGDRPMADWIFRDPDHTALYHQYFAEFLETADPAAIIAEASALIGPYVERDPTKFCTYEDYQTGVQALTEFCRLRTESVSGQLAGTIPSTAAGQAEDRAALVDASGLTLSDMGSMGNGPGGGFRGPGGSGETGRPGGHAGAFGPADADGQPGAAPQPESDALPDNSAQPDGFPQPDGSTQLDGSPQPDSSAQPDGSPQSDGSAPPDGFPQPDDSAQPNGFPQSDGSAPPDGSPQSDGSTRPDGSPQSDGNTRPDGFPQPDGGAGPRTMAFSGEEGPPDASGGVSTESLLLLGGSAALLLGGVLLLRRYRRWGV